MGDDGHEVYGVYQGRIACSRARASPQGLFSIKLSVSLALHNDTSLKTKVRPRRPTHAPTQQNNASHRHTDSHRETGAPQSAPFRLLLSSSSSSTATTTTYASAARS